MGFEAPKVELYGYTAIPRYVCMANYGCHVHLKLEFHPQVVCVFPFHSPGFGRFGDVMSNDVTSFIIYPLVI